MTGCLAILICLLAGCELVPSKPDVVFTLYKERMKSAKLSAARELLSDSSRALVDQLNSKYDLKQTPENLALLNILDPVTPPAVMKAEDTYALIQVRTLKGEFRLVRLTRKDSGAPWKIDLTEDLKALQSFLQARSTLELMREQAGEYAESWKAFSDQLGKMKITQPEPPKPSPPPKKTLRKSEKKPTANKHPAKKHR